MITCSLAFRYAIYATEESQICRIIKLLMEWSIKQNSLLYDLVVYLFLDEHFGIRTFKTFILNYARVFGDVYARAVWTVLSCFVATTLVFYISIITHFS